MFTRGKASAQFFTGRRLPVGDGGIKNVSNDPLEYLFDESLFNIADIELIIEVFIEGEALVLEAHLFVKRVDVGSPDSDGEPC